MSDWYNTVGPPVEDVATRQTRERNDAHVRHSADRQSLAKKQKQELDELAARHDQESLATAKRQEIERRHMTPDSESKYSDVSSDEKPIPAGYSDFSSNLIDKRTDVRRGPNDQGVTPDSTAWNSKYSVKKGLTPDGDEAITHKPLGMGKTPDG